MPVRGDDDAEKRVAHNTTGVVGDRHGDVALERCDLLIDGEQARDPGTHAEAVRASKEPGYEESDWAPMLYYSVVTFTTLGFGDIVPRTQEAAWWIMAEVVMGYFMLGGLITILATKLARRS